MTWKDKTMRGVMLAAFLAWGSSACGVDVAPANGKQRCAEPPAKACTQGFYCAQDGFCWKNGTEPQIEEVSDAGGMMQSERTDGAVDNLRGDALGLPDSGAEESPRDAASVDPRKSDAGVDAAVDADPPPSMCGNNIKESGEVCDEGPNPPNELGRCAPNCAGYVDKKFILSTIVAFGGGGGVYDGDLGGPAGADARCQQVFSHRGGVWKALLVGGGRRATTTPHAGDGQVDWVIRRYTHYFNWRDELIWRTDGAALLGTRAGERVNLFAPGHDGNYPWGGWKTDWTEQEESSFNGTCRGWTSNSDQVGGTFPLDDLKKGSGDPCSYKLPLLCVEQ